MTKVMSVGIASIVIAMLMLTPMVCMAGTMEEGDGYTTEVQPAQMATPPTLDGVIDVNEWDTATIVDIEYTVENYTSFTNDTVYMYFGNDAEFFYFAIDMTFATDDTDEILLFWAIDANGDGDMIMEENLEPAGYAYTNTTSREVMSTMGYLFGIGFGESVNSETEHYMFEYAVPILNLQDEDGELAETMGFAAYSEMSSANETFTYPIDVDVSGDPEDASDWAEITLTVTAEEEVNDMAETYAMVMFIVGTLVVAILLVAHKETIYKWIAEGRDTYVFIALGLVVVLFVLGFIQWMYDWVGMLM